MSLKAYNLFCNAVIAGNLVLCAFCFALAAWELWKHRRNQ